MQPDELRLGAAFLRDGIIYRVLSPADAVAWADGLIEAGNSLPSAIYDLSTAPGKATSVVLESLNRLTDILDVTEPIAHALLDVIADKVERGQMSIEDAIAVAYRLTRPLGAGSGTWADALILEENYSLAVDGIVGSVTDLQCEARDWLGSFRRAAAGFPAHAV